MKKKLWQQERRKGLQVAAAKSGKKSEKKKIEKKEGKQGKKARLLRWGRKERKEEILAFSSFGFIFSYPCLSFGFI